MDFHNVLMIFLASFVALFPVIDPVGSGLIVNGYFGDIDEKERKVYTKSILLYCLMVGGVSLIAGHLILLVFGLAVPVIQLAGGFVICKTGLEWLSESDEIQSEEEEKRNALRKKNNIAAKLFYPIAFPICMGPGVISVIFTLMATGTSKTSLLTTGINYAIILAAMVLLLVILYLVIATGPKITRRLGKSGTMVINKLIAFITFCIGIQIMISGIGKIFHLDIL